MVESRDEGKPMVNEGRLKEGLYRLKIKNRRPVAKVANIVFEETHYELIPVVQEPKDGSDTQS